MGEVRHCVVCGRVIEPRARWGDDWERVRRCSAACRRARLGEIDGALEAAVLTLSRERGRGKTICPSEAARVVGGEGWRPLMGRARWAVNRLCAGGRVEVTQGGRVVEHSRARGAIRVRLVR